MTTAKRVLYGLETAFLTFALSNAHARLRESGWAIAFFAWSGLELGWVVVALIRQDKRERTDP